MAKETDINQEAYTFFSWLTFFEHPDTRETLFRTLHALITQEVLTPEILQTLLYKDSIDVAQELLENVDLNQSSPDFTKIFYAEFSKLFQLLSVLFAAAQVREISFYEAYLEALRIVCEENSDSDYLS